MITSKDITVDGVRYLVTQYTAGKSVRLFAKLMKVVGKPLSLLSSEDQGAQVTTKILGDMIQGLAAQVTPEELDFLCREILEGSLVFTEDGKNQTVTQIYDIHFQGKIGHLFKVLKEVLQFQYSDFLGGLAVSMPELTATAKTGRSLTAL